MYFKNYWHSIGILRINHMFTTTCNQTIKVNISLVSAVRLQEDNRVTLDVTISGWWPGITQVPAVVRLQEDNST